VFLIRAAGHTRAPILAELNRRILLPDEVEAAIVAAELRATRAHPAGRACRDRNKTGACCLRGWGHSTRTRRPRT
jgi:hypothetical protein